MPSRDQRMEAGRQRRAGRMSGMDAQTARDYSLAQVMGHDNPYAYAQRQQTRTRSTPYGSPYGQGFGNAIERQQAYQGPRNPYSQEFPGISAVPTALAGDVMAFADYGRTLPGATRDLPRVWGGDTGTTYNPSGYGVGQTAPYYYDFY